MIYIGIDPGLSGGIAALTEDGGVMLAIKMPATERDILLALKGIGVGRLPARAVLEKVGVMPKQGIVSAFTFGRGVGALLMALTAAEIPFDQVLPATWQQVLSCRTRGDKNITKRRAQQLFPTQKVTHAIADALLIAEYCRRIHRGQHGKEESRGAQVHPEAPRRSKLAQTRDRAIARFEGREVTAAEARTALAGASRHGAGPQPKAR
jgi:crossover junction endodeoxyribonuclease RuvC